jgi:hypothetical protein
MATAEVAARQRERWQWGPLPIDPLAADAWLAAHADAPPEVRATVLATAGRPDEARALLGRASPSTPLDTVRLERLRILFAAEAAEDHSIDDALTRLDRRWRTFRRTSSATSACRSRGQSPGCGSAPANRGGTTWRRRFARSGHSGSRSNSASST